MNELQALKQIRELSQLTLLSGISRPLAQEDMTRSYWEIVDSWRDGLWQLAPHQRQGDRWSPTQQILWIERLASPIAPIGCFLTYNLGDIQVVYLNDGLQRLMTLLKFLENSESFGFRSEDAKTLLKSRSTVVQRRIYDKHDQAMIDFQLANIGTLMTAKEFYKGILTYTPGYETDWKPLLDDFEKHMHMAGSRILSEASMKSMNVATQHAHERHNYVLIIKFVNKIAGMNRYKLVTRSMEAKDILDKHSVEFELSEIIRRLPINQAQRELSKLKDMIDRETSLIKDIWENTRKEPKNGLSSSAYRWLLDIAIWKRFNTIPDPIWEDFVHKVLLYSNGKGQLSSPEQPGEVANLSVGQPGRIMQVCRITKHNILDYIQRRKRSNLQPEPGNDISHIRPFSEEGNGPVIIEPASRNRSRGAKPIGS